MIRENKEVVREKYFVKSVGTLLYSIRPFPVAFRVDNAVYSFALGAFEIFCLPTKRFTI